MLVSVYHKTLSCFNHLCDPYGTAAWLTVHRHVDYQPESARAPNAFTTSGRVSPPVVKLTHTTLSLT
jgi:hypothetical protein